ncbi:MAG TPA: diguanylate cyclase [Thermoleophilaceae bacterium]|nr:diguanylate cyclase [Thermoleophilaceae bacterium]
MAGWVGQADVREDGTGAEAVAAAVVRAAATAGASADAVTGLNDARRMIDDLDAGLALARVESPLVLAVFDLIGFKEYNDDFGRACGDVLLARLARSLEDTIYPRGNVYRLRGDEFAALVRSEDVAEEGRAALSERGAGFEVSAVHATAVLPADATDAREALKLADQRLVAERAGPADLQALERLRAEGRSRDRGLGELVVAVATRLGAGPAELAAVECAADLREVAARLALPEGIASGDQAGTEDARRYGELMALAGERVLRSRFGLHGAADAVRALGERWDGRGRPDGLAAEQIPLAARVIAPCVTYAALRGRGFTEGDAAGELCRFVGTRFDPVVVGELIACVQAGDRTGTSLV